MNVNNLKELAQIISLAQDIREASFKPNEDTPAFLLGRYTCSRYDSAIKAASQITKLPHEHMIVEAIARIVYLLNTGMWNDVSAWSRDILKLPEPEHEPEGETE